MKGRLERSLPYAFPISLTFEIKMTNTKQTTSRNQFMTGI